MERKTTEELVEIADRLMLACPRFGEDQPPPTPEEETQLAAITEGPSQVDFRNLFVIFMVRHNREGLYEILSA